MSDDLRAEIGTNIARFVHARRKDLGMSLEDVAVRADMTKSHVWEIEKWRSSNPTISTALRLCDALQCSLDSLIGMDVSQPRMTDEEIALVHAHRKIFGERR